MSDGIVVYGTHIVRTPGILGGDARFAGTRIAVWHVEDYLKTHHGPSMLMDWGLNHWAIMDGIQFTFLYPEEVAKDRARNTDPQQNTKSELLLACTESSDYDELYKRVMEIAERL